MDPSLCRDLMTLPFVFGRVTVEDVFPRYRDTVVMRYVVHFTLTLQVSGCCMSPDGKYIVSASWDKTLLIWDSSTLTTSVTTIAPNHDPSPLPSSTPVPSNIREYLQLYSQSPEPKLSPVVPISTVPADNKSKMKSEDEISILGNHRIVNIIICECNE